MKVKVGQAVVVLHAHAGGADMSGVVVSPGANEYTGKWWVDIGDTKLPVEPERIVDATSYYARLRARHAHPPKS
jgi:hypothetical protein